MGTPANFRSDPIARRHELRGYVVEDGSLPIWGRTSPLAAEQALLSEHNFKFWEVTDRDRAEFEKAAWPWHVACCWLAWGTIDGGSQSLAAFREWGGLIWRDTEMRPGQKRLLREAENALFSALQEDEFRASVIGPDGIIRSEPDEWLGLKWEPGPLEEVVSFDNLTWNGKRRYGPVTVPRNAVMRLLERLNGEPCVDASPAKDRADRTLAETADDGAMETGAFSGNGNHDDDLAEMPDANLDGKDDTQQPECRSPDDQVEFAPKLFPKRKGGQPNKSGLYEVAFHQGIKDGISIDETDWLRYLRFQVDSKIDASRRLLDPSLRSSISRWKANLRSAKNK